MKKPCCKCHRGAPYSGEWDEATQCRECYLYANLPEYRAQCDGGGPGTEAFGGSFAITPATHPEQQPAAPSDGPGTRLKEMIAQLGLPDWQGCQCEARARQMNEWGGDGCRAHRQEIIGWLKEAFQFLSLADKFRAVKAGITWVDPFDPFGSIVDEAIRRAEAEEPQEPSPM